MQRSHVRRETRALIVCVHACVRACSEWLPLAHTFVCSFVYVFVRACVCACERARARESGSQLMAVNGSRALRLCTP